MSTLRQKVLSGVFWRLMEQIGTQLVGFVVSVILARLLEPKDFGTITLITVFIALAGVFVQGGFGTALVQKKEICAADYDSVFYLSLSVSVLLYGFLYACAPFVASLYEQPALCAVLRVLSLSLFVGAFNMVQTAILTREMKFRLSFYACLVATVLSGLVGVGMALNGMRHWSLVGSALTAQIANTAVLWRVVAWRPRWVFSLDAVKGLFRFGSNLLIIGLLDTLFRNLYNIIIGKLFNSTTLGYYSRGQSIPNLVMSSVQGTVSSVIFPALAACQNDIARVREITRRLIKSTCFLVFPMMFGLAAVARPLVSVLLTDKWLPCVPFLQLSCITFALWPLHVANIQAFTAIGRSDLFLRLELVKKIIIVVSIVVTYRWGVTAMMIGQVVCGFLAVVINAWPSRRLIHYSLAQQTGDILPAFGLAACMSIVVWGLSEWISQNLLLLAAQFVVGASVYIFGAVAFKLESARYVWRIGCSTAATWISGFQGRRRV